MNIILQDQSSETQLLSEWTKTEDRWRDLLLEALCIANINRGIIKLGFNLHELQGRYIPSNPETNLYIHPMIKGLYWLCENLVPTTTAQLILHIKNKYGVAIPNCSVDYLEMHLLFWLTNRINDDAMNVLTLGDTNEASTLSYRQVFCNIESILTFLKSKPELTNNHSKLQKISYRLNYTKRNVIGRDNNAKVDKNKQQQFEKDEQERASMPHSLPVPVNNNDVYQVTKSNTGFILIINLKYFYNMKPKMDDEKPLDTREGTDKDRDCLEATFKKFGYVPIIKESITATQIRDIVRSTVKKSKTKDSLIVCILSHGRKGTFYSADSEQIQIDEIKRIMASKDLKNKPKMLIIQACQTEGSSVDERTLEADGDNDYFYDMITGWSTVSGYNAFRDTVDGSWFIQTLCHKVQEFGGTHHMLDISTKVNASMSEKKGPNKESMTPNWENTLKRQFYLQEQA